MIHIPILVIGRVAAFADSDSLVLLSCCSKWLRYCVSQHNNIWHQRYRQYYNLADGNEIKWLAWYVKTVRASKLLALQTKKTASITQLSNQHIEWFHAFCYRRATDANWLKSAPYPVKDLTEEESDNTRSIILQRIVYHHTDIHKCFIAEQCQPIGDTFTKRFWYLRKLFHNDINCKSQIKQCLISDRFVVTISRQRNSTNHIRGKTCTISIWPVNRISITRPRQFSCLCDIASISGRWMVVNQLERAVKGTNRSNIITTTRVFDLANGQMCMGTITTCQSELFLLRVTEESAIIFSKSLHRSDTITTLKWNVWKFSNRYLGYGPRCLMQGKIRFKTSKDFKILVKKLNDNWVLVEHNSPFNVNTLNENREYEISLAMISTECGYSNACIKDVKPIWTRSDCLYGTIPLFGSNRILVISESGWTIYNSIDGTILAHTNVDTLSSMLKVQYLLDIDKYANLFSLYIAGFVIYSSKYDNTFIAIDPMHPTRTRNLGITNSEYLYKKSFEHPYIVTRFNYMIKDHLLLNDNFSTRNAMLMVDGEDYKIIDLSF